MLRSFLNLNKLFKSNVRETFDRDQVSTKTKEVCAKCQILDSNTISHYKKMSYVKFPSLSIQTCIQVFLLSVVLFSSISS